MTTYTSLDEANKRIAELEEKLAHALEVGGARGRLLANAEAKVAGHHQTIEGYARELRGVEAERDLLRAQSAGRGEMIEVLTKEVADGRAMLRAAMQELLTICRLAGAKLPTRITEAAKSAGFDVG